MNVKTELVFVVCMSAAIIQSGILLAFVILAMQVLRVPVLISLPVFTQQ